LRLWQRLIKRPFEAIGRQYAGNLQATLVLGCFKNCDFFVFWCPKVLTRLESVVLSRASLVKKLSYLPKQKHCEWFAVWLTGPRLILVLQVNKLCIQTTERCLQGVHKVQVGKY
jgi:hypothetical protein